MLNADDFTLWESCDRSGHNSQIQTVADQASEWTNKKKMQLITDKTKHMCIYFGKNKLQLKSIVIGGVEIDNMAVTKLLGMMIYNELNWSDHINYISKKAGQHIYFVCILKGADKPPNETVAVYTLLIRSVIKYACEL